MHGKVPSSSACNNRNSQRLICACGEATYLLKVMKLQAQIHMCITTTYLKEVFIIIFFIVYVITTEEVLLQTEFGFELYSGCVIVRLCVKTWLQFFVRTKKIHAHFYY